MSMRADQMIYTIVSSILTILYDLDVGDKGKGQDRLSMPMEGLVGDGISDYTYGGDFASFAVIHFASFVHLLFPPQPIYSMPPVICVSFYHSSK